MAGDAKNDLFGDSSSSDADTDDLIAAANSHPVARKKAGAAAARSRADRNNFPDVDGDGDDDDDADAQTENRTGAGLFDSSSEDEEAPGPSKAKAKTLGRKRGGKKKPAAAKRPAPKDTRSRKERMAALAKKRAGTQGDKAASPGAGDGEPRKKRTKAGGEGGEDGKGYDSGDSYDSADIQRTRADDEFIDAADEDPDALKELYAEQHFDDERPDGYDSDDEGGGKKKKRGASAGGRGGKGGAGLDKISLSDDEGCEGASASNALKAACRRMQKAKKEKKTLGQLEEEGTAFLRGMDEAADLDAASVAAKRPATKRLALLPRVLDTLARKDMARVLLDLDLLSACKRWVEPLPNGSLGNVTLRRRILEALAAMTGENGIATHDLKRSGFGKTAMTLYMHRSETPEMKKLLKGLIEQWSRPIFQKSGNMRDLERVQATRGANEMGSLVGIARSQQHDGGREERRKSAGGDGRIKTEDELKHIISKGSKAANEIGNNRVRVPYSRGFQYSVRPESRKGDVSDKRNLVSAKAAAASGGAAGGFRESERREALSKRMLDKSRKTNKQGQRSANISIEGRAVK